MNSDDIIKTMKGYMDSETPIAPSAWIDCALHLNSCFTEENDKLIGLEQSVAQRRLEIMDHQDKRNVAEAKVRIEATDIFADMKRQEAKVDQITEFIRLAKHYARIKSNEYGANF